MKQTRKPNIHKHRARPTRVTMSEEERLAYINFINTLMHRMKTDGVKKMFDLAMKEIDQSAGGTS